jgi:large subunit ribosomal protein L35
MEMPKMKTKSGAKKRFRVTASGKIKFKPAKMRHMQMNKPKSMKRKARKTGILNEMDTKVILINFLPYQMKKKKRAIKKAAQLANKQAAKAAAANQKDAA